MHTPKQNSIRSLPEYWRWLGTRVRLGLTPDEPRLITAYLETGRQACLADLLHPWQMNEQSFQTLLAAALDPHLPWHWRSHCLSDPVEHAAVGEVGLLRPWSSRRTRLRW
jgi:hypothetical protein